MVEQMGVEPTTYTMRTYRSSQLSYCPKSYGLYYYTPFFRKSKLHPVFFTKNRRFDDLNGHTTNGSPHSRLDFDRKKACGPFYGRFAKAASAV